jgi:hypothetical protein
MEQMKQLDQYKKARKEIITLLKSGIDELQISQVISAHFSLDKRQAYRWVTFVQDDFMKRAKRVRVIGIIVFWTGFLGMLAGLVSRIGIFSDFELQASLFTDVALLAGGVLGLVGLLLALMNSQFFRKAL